MTPREELKIRREIQSALDSGDIRAELLARRKLKSASAQSTPEIADPYANPDLGGNFMVDLGRGFMDVAQGGKQLALMAGERLGLAEPGSAQSYTDRITEEISQYEADRGALNPGRFTGNLLSTVAVPGGVAGGAGMRLGTAALSGAGIGAAMPATGENLLSDKATNAAFGAAGGAAGSAIMSGLGKGVNMLRGRVGQGVDNPVQEAFDEADRFGVAMTAGDASGGAILPKLETTLESVPVIGMGRVRERQTNQARVAAERLLERSGDVGQDVGDVIQKSAQREFQTRREIAREMFNQVTREADDYGIIPLTNMARLAKEQITRLEQIALENPGLTDDIQRRIDALEPFSHEGKLTYSQIRELVRANLSDLIDSMYAPGAVIGKKGVEKFEPLRRALEDDLEAGIREIGGETLDKYQRAKKFYQSNVVPYKKGQGVGISTVLDTAEPERIISRWVKGGKKDRAAALYDALNDEGREAVRVGILREAYEAATSGPNAQNGVFSPAAFANEIKKYKDAIPSFFKGDAKAEIEGFQKLMQHIKRAGQYMENPSTGARLLTPLLFAGAAGYGLGADLATTSAAGGGAFLLTVILSSKAGRTALLSASKVEAGSKEMQGVIDQISRAVRSGASTGAVQSRNYMSPPTQESQRTNLLAP